jgi:(hydroxyamino)benzene mutase
MSPDERRLCRSGLLLFFLGLALGFLVHRLPNPRGALSAHLNAVQSGTALMVIGVMWSRIRLLPRLAAPVAIALPLAFWGLELRILASAFAWPSNGLLMRSATLLGAVSALTMVLAVALVLLAFRSRPGDRADASAHGPVAATIADAMNGPASA